MEKINLKELKLLSLNGNQISDKTVVEKLKNKFTILIEEDDDSLIWIIR